MARIIRKEEEHDPVSLALETATLLSTVSIGTTSTELTNHLDRINDAITSSADRFATLWLAAMATTVVTASVYAATRDICDDAMRTEFDQKMNTLAAKQIEIVRSWRAAAT